jgi:hypothetical protein
LPQVTLLCWETAPLTIENALDWVEIDIPGRTSQALCASSQLSRFSEDENSSKYVLVIESK